MSTIKERVLENAEVEVFRRDKVYTIGFSQKKSSILMLEQFTLKEGLCHKHNEEEIRGYYIRSFMRHITKPLCDAFFMGNSEFDENVVDRLADFIELNTLVTIVDKD